MALPRRGFVLAGLNLAGSAVTQLLMGQDRSRPSVHPPDPSGHELDILSSREGTPRPRPAMNARQRDAQFRSCLDQLQSSVVKLRDKISGSPLSEVLSVEVYRETQAMERLVKQLKSLAKS